MDSVSLMYKEGSCEEEKRSAKQEKSGQSRMKVNKRTNTWGCLLYGENAQPHS